MGSDRDGGYSLTEIFVVKFVIADVVIIAALLLRGWLAALGFAFFFLFTTFLIWWIGERNGSGEADEPVEPIGVETGDADPVTTLQHRYAVGELTEDEFEARLERLIDANERADRAGIETSELSLDRSS